MRSTSAGPEHLLVTGLPRTGTSLIAGALARHAEVAMLNEAPQEYAALIIGKRFAGNKLYLPSQVDYRFAEDGRGRLSLRRRQEGRKKGYLYSYMEQRTRIVLTYREASSSIEALVSAMAVQPDVAVRLWAHGMELSSKLVKDYRRRLFVCEYESLKENPTQELSRVLSFLSLERDEACSSFLRDSFEVPHMSQPDDSVDRWRLSELAPKAFAMYNGLCSFRMECEARQASDSDGGEEASDRSLP